MEIKVRTYTLDDWDALYRIQRECFPPPFPEEQIWSREQIAGHLRIFPEGALCAEVNGEVVGSCTALIVQFDPAHPDHSWAVVTDSGSITTHNPQGDTLYGVDVSVRPDFRGKGVAKAMYQARFNLVRRLGLTRFMAGGRMPGYHRYADRLTPEAYAAEVIAGRIIDPVITAQLKAGLKPVQVVHNYLIDEESGNNALLLEWRP